MALKKYELKQSGGIDSEARERKLLEEEEKQKDKGWEVFLNGMNQVDLLSLRDKIDGKLTGITLADVDLVSEMLFQLKRAKELQNDTKKDTTVPSNQRAQIQNSLGTLLERLSKYQIELHSSERLKRIETVLIRTMKTQPPEIQTAFFEAYTKELKNDA